MKVEASKEDIDFIFENIVGGSGLWQWLFVVGFSFPIQLASTVPLLIHLFAAYEPKHRCYIPGCDPNDKYWSSNDSYLEFAIPLKSASGLFDQDANYDSCSMYQVLDSTSCHPVSFDNATLDQCQSYVYDTSLFTETLTTKFDLVIGIRIITFRKSYILFSNLIQVCDQHSKSKLLSTIMMLGLLIGGLLGGTLSDKFGRKNTILVATLAIIPTTMFAGYSPNYACYAFLR